MYVSDDFFYRRYNVMQGILRNIIWEVEKVICEGTKGGKFVK